MTDYAAEGREVSEIELQRLGKGPVPVKKKKPVNTETTYTSHTAAIVFTLIMIYFVVSAPFSLILSNTPLLVEFLGLEGVMEVGRSVRNFILWPIVGNAPSIVEAVVAQIFSFNTVLLILTAVSGAITLGAPVHADLKWYGSTVYMLVLFGFGVFVLLFWIPFFMMTFTLFAVGGPEVLLILWKPILIGAIWWGIFNWMGKQ